MDGYYTESRPLPCFTSESITKNMNTRHGICMHLDDIYNIMA